MENWIPIEGYEGWYEFSNLGNVRSLDRKVDFVDGRYATYKGKSIKQAVNSNGYLVVQLWRNSKMKMMYIHRLIAELNIPNPDNKPFVNHIDGNKLNNNPSNLEWVTYLENVQHANATGLTPETHCARPVKQYDLKGNLIASYDSIYEAGTKTGFDKSKIGLVMRGKRKTHKGFVWKGED